MASFGCGAEAAMLGMGDKIIYFPAALSSTATLL